MTNDNELIALLDEVDTWLLSVQQQIIGAKASRNIATLAAALRERLAEIEQLREWQKGLQRTTISWAEEIGKLQADAQRFALSGQCDNGAHSVCPYPDRCRCGCHASSPLSLGNICKVVPVADSWSVAIGSLGIKLFSSQTDADACCAAINTAIRASSPSSLAESQRFMVHEPTMTVQCNDSRCPVGSTMVGWPHLMTEGCMYAASSPSPLDGDKVEGKSELEAAYHAAVRAGLSSTEGRTFQEWRDRVSDYGLDDAQQALAIERERAR